MSVIRQEALRDAAAIAMTHALQNGALERKCRRDASTAGSISGREVEIEYAVAHSRMARNAHTIAKQILALIPGTLSDPSLPPVDYGLDALLRHAQGWLEHLRSDEPLMRHTVADNIERALTVLTSQLAQAQIPTTFWDPQEADTTYEHPMDWLHQVGVSWYVANEPLVQRFACSARLADTWVLFLPPDQEDGEWTGECYASKAEADAALANVNAAQRDDYEASQLRATKAVTPKHDNYRGWVISYDPPPIPVRDFDWSATHPDYDGAEDANDNRCVFGKSSDAVRAEIDAWYDENEPTTPANGSERS